MAKIIKDLILDPDIKREKYYENTYFGNCKKIHPSYMSGYGYGWENENEDEDEETKYYKELYGKSEEELDEMEKDIIKNSLEKNIEKNVLSIDEMNKLDEDNEFIPFDSSEKFYVLERVYAYHSKLNKFILGNIIVITPAEDKNPYITYTIDPIEDDLKFFDSTFIRKKLMFLPKRNDENDESNEHYNG